MQRQTEVELDAASVVGAKYDAMCKKLFQNKEILAPVLKEVVPEYKNCTMQQVIDCIDGSSIYTAPVDDVSAATGKLPSEMDSITDKLIRYDARFLAVNPNLTTETMRFYLHIDIEVQNSYKPENPSYPIIKRAIYYAAREISSQLGVLTGETDYKALQKCYSIWICNEDIPWELHNTVSFYTLTKQDLIGKTEEPEADYDLMSIILIRRGDKHGKDAIFDYLTGIFHSDMQKIEKYVDMERNEELKKEVKKMSGMGMSIARENYRNGVLAGQAEGIQKGRAEGIQEGRAEGFSEGINNFSALMQMLLSSSRMEDALKVATDSAYRDRLLEEYKKSH